MAVDIRQGHVCDVLAALPERHYHTVCTSPPYWQLRRYGTEPQVWGGDLACDHDWVERGRSATRLRNGLGSDLRGMRTPATEAVHTLHPQNGASCTRCGAWRGELGSEPTVDAFVDHLVTAFDAVWRVLRDDGTLWVNLGDSYYNNPGGQNGGANNSLDYGAGRISAKAMEANRQVGRLHRVQPHAALKQKDLCLIPFRFALAMQERGWYLRSVIPWCKTAPMPESCEDRPTSAWEPIFLFAKSGRTQFWAHRDGAGTRTPPVPDYRWYDRANDDAETANEPENWRTEYLEDGKARRWARRNLWRGHDYFYDSFAVRQPATWQRDNNPEWQYQRAETNVKKGACNRNALSGGFTQWQPEQGANLRNYWIINPEPSGEEHYAAYPTALVKTPILAGTSERGCCPTCGAPWRRVTEKQKGDVDAVGRPKSGPGGYGAPKSTLSLGGNGSKEWAERGPKVFTRGWVPTCACPAHEPVPCRVLDPFGGSGTTAIVADQLGRDCTLIELNARYAEMARRRVTNDAPLFAQVAVTALPAPAPPTLFDYAEGAAS